MARKRTGKWWHYHRYWRGWLNKDQDSSAFLRWQVFANHYNCRAQLCVADCYRQISLNFDDDKEAQPKLANLIQQLLAFQTALKRGQAFHVREETARIKREKAEEAKRKKKLPKQ